MPTGLDPRAEERGAIAGAAAPHTRRHASEIHTRDKPAGERGTPTAGFGIFPGQVATHSTNPSKKGKPDAGDTPNVQRVPTVPKKLPCGHPKQFHGEDLPIDILTCQIEQLIGRVGEKLE